MLTRRYPCAVFYCFILLLPPSPVRLHLSAPHSVLTNSLASSVLLLDETDEQLALFPTH